MTSRLDRLFVLLEAGTGPATRRAAARQLGEVQKAHPEELHRLLGRLTKHLRSPAWETRVAAAQAVEAILANVPEWHPPPFAVKTEDVKTEPDVEDTGRLRCETFDIERVLQHGAHLMGSEGNEYDLEEEALSSADASERLARQRQQLNARLGLDVAANLGVDLTSMYTNEDLCPTITKPPPNKTETIRTPIQELVSVSQHLSSRERNLAKRKARAAFSKQKSRDCSEEGPSAPPTPPVEPDRKKMKLEPVDDFVFESGAPVPDCSGTWGESSHWPLDSWCLALQAQLFSATWEARHGAASALRELLRAKVATTAGLRAGMNKEQMEDAHQEWLEDMALRLLCVLALDRFGDFVSDQVVAPVRETCAQTLGVALAVLRSERVRCVASLLATLATQPQWEARHGALLGFKYLLAAREVVACSSGALEHLMEGLGDAAEDVSAVAATALAPAAGALAAARPHCLQPVVERLWRLLRDQDELAAPANAYMALLAALMALPEPARLLHPIDLSDILPRLWPYLDHNTSTVRKATLQTLRTLTRPLITQKYTNGDKIHEKNEITTNGENILNSKLEQEQNSHSDPTSDVELTNKHQTNSNSENPQKVNANGDSDVKVNGENKMDESDTVTKSNTKVSDSDKLMWTPELLQEAMRYIYQRVLFEHVHEIQDIAVQVWSNLLQYASLDCILIAACPMLATWLCLAMQPARLPVDSALILQPPAKERRTRTTSQSQDKDVMSEVRGTQKWYIGGSESQPGGARDRNVTRARCLAADILGHLSCYLVQPAPGIEYKAEDESPIDCYVKVMVVYFRAGSALQRLVASLVVSAWARHAKLTKLWPRRINHDQEGDGNNDHDISNLAPPLLVNTLHTVLNQSLYYDEVALNCNRILQEARDLLAMMKHYKLPVGDEFNNILRLEQVVHMTSITQPMVSAMKIKRVATTLEDRRRNLQTSVNQCTVEQGILNVSVQAALAGACSALHALPDKLNPVVRPLMESIKKEPSEELQHNSSVTLAVLLEQLVDRDSCPNNKVLVNLKAFLRCDPDFTPRIQLENTEESCGDSGSGDSGPEGKPEPDTHRTQLDKYNGILTLWEQQRAAEVSAPRRGRPPAVPHAPVLNNKPNEDEARKLLRIQRRGATLALNSLTEHFGDELPQKLPKLWEFISEPFSKVMTDDELNSQDPTTAEELISCLQVFEAVCKGDHPLRGAETAGAKAACALSRSKYTAVRHMAARVLAALANARPTDTMHAIIHELIPALSDVRSERVRCGAAEALARATEALQLRAVPYIVLLVIPLLGESRHLQQLIPALSDVRSERVRCGAAEALARATEALQLRAVPYIVLLVIPLLGESRHLQQLIPALSDVRSERVRCGAAEALARATEALQLRAVPYIVLLVIPLLGESRHLQQLIPALSDVRSERVRCGAAEALARATEALQLRAVPYIVLLVIPLLGESRHLQQLIPALSDVRSERVRCGAAEALARATEALQLRAVPYIVLLVIPLLGESRHLQQLIPALSDVRSERVRCGAAEALARATEALQLRAVPYIVLLVIPLLGESRHLQQLIPALSDVRSERVRCGAAEALARATEALQLRAVPYIVLLVIPLLGRMSDHCEAVRIMSTRCFASLIQLMPLDGAVPEPPGLSPELKDRRLRDKDFLEQLFNPKSIKDYKIPVPISVELRGYQQAGVNWLRFLYSYGLHGVLCDDMGLGKTLQSIAAVASAHAERAAERLPGLPSLVACPPTLTGHWVCEVNKFIPSNCLKPLQYVGPPAERERLRQQVKLYNFIVASYDMIRKDIDFFSSIKWNYCILDEGHVIKNGKTKAFKAIKQLVANHRLILSGTPIQNNVLELWSLFDFLMPGLLGTERQFTARYSRPILQAREPRAAPLHLQAGALACEALHRQVLPFLLRRVKEDVLKELPPKITQDYYCELSPLQRRLYEDFSRRHMPQADIASSHSHVFQALHYLQNVCNHPKLVLTQDHPEANNIALQLQSQHSTLDDIEHSAKLPALKQLLLECGIGTTTQDTTVSVVSQHRALIFCQLKKMLDIVEVDLLQRHLPSVSYLRLDGKVPPHKRHAIVSRFNNDVSIDVLLLTTAVGGLGLNLTGADTVIFVEHDWNPMKDLQAMDRAHRIGQKKVVNVYRLITRDTLEEKIMGLQKFKLLTANTVISSENAAMETMGTDQLLDLFKVASENAGAAPPARAAGAAGTAGTAGTASAGPEALPDLWDDAQYEEEYDMTQFIKGLDKMKT